ncbi:hypothetical protein AX766_03950 [Flavobacterium covae]|uniref:hypothetical protein n=1 Tax=Flavobacterium covae TaxID=2906076 RepID=UPI0007C186DF|nr:hypothetical protein [Flavobacterium covae]AND63618.1 hypothetical protein AX766_03950 [Flavobacterium covae]
MQKYFIIDAIDVLAGYEIQETPERIQTLLTVVDVVCGYPKPTKKGSTITTANYLIGAYLHVSNARNACRLGAMGFIDTLTAYKIASSNLENALTLLS